MVMKDVASGVLKDEAAAALEAAGNVSAVEKLQALLTKVRSNGGGGRRVWLKILERSERFRSLSHARLGGYLLFHFDRMATALSLDAVAMVLQCFMKSSIRFCS